MKILILCPGKMPRSIDDISCFTEVINFYLPKSIAKFSSTDVKSIPINDNETLKNLFSSIPVDSYDAILTLGLRFYSKISLETTMLLKSRFSGLLCQIYDGTRLDYDPVDITFTFKNEDLKLATNPGWYARHKKFNEYMGWAADSNLNVPMQNATDLRILVDHTNYGENEIDKTKQVLIEIKKFVSSGIWKEKFKSVSVRRFDSGKVVDVNLDDLNYEKYDRNKSMPISEISKEHCKAHIFCVTHPESVGLVVLETALAGAFIVSPKDFIAKDRLETVRHYEWSENIIWTEVLKKINISLSRKKAEKNSWDQAAMNIVNSISKRLST